MNSILGMLALGAAFISPVSIFGSDHQSMMSDYSSSNTMMGGSSNEEDSDGLFSKSRNWMSNMMSGYSQGDNMMNRNYSSMMNGSDYDNMMEDYNYDYDAMMNDYNNSNNMMEDATVRSYGCH